MSSVVFRLGSFSARHRGVVLASWLVVLAVLGAAIFLVPNRVEGSAEFELPGSEASRALEVMDAEFGSADPDTASATVVFEAQDGADLSGAAAEEVTGVLADIAATDGVLAVSDPFSEQSPQLSADGRIAAASVTLSAPDGTLPESTTAALDEITAAGADDVRVVADWGSSVTTQVGGVGEMLGVAVAALVLLLTYGSLAAAGANLLTSFIGVAIANLGLLVIGKFEALQSTTPVLAAMLGLAVGIDYALFIFSRFRTELRRGATPRDAAASATASAGTAVVFAGSTVVVALVGLAVLRIPFLTEMGLAAAATVVLAVLIAVTAVPALLSLLGHRALGVRERSRGTRGSESDPVEDPERTPRYLERWVGGVTRRPWLVVVSCVAVLGTLALPVLGLRIALPSAATADPESTSRQVADLMAEGFGAGSQTTIVVLVEAEDAAATAEQVAQTVTAVDDVAALGPVIPSASGASAFFTVVPSTGPVDEETEQLVQDIRAAVDGVPDAQVSVTGATAIQIDISEALRNALPEYIIVIVALALVLLLLLFRSIVVPLLATAGFLLSLGAALGATVAVFQWGWLADVFGVAQPAPLLSFLPVLVVGIVFGLAMDYQVFLVTAMREAYDGGRDARAAVIHGFRRSSPVVVAAALIMAAVFIGFATSGESTVGSISLALTVGVLADALVVRMMLVPAVLTLLGDRAWWLPRRLDKVLPHVDVEGHGRAAEPVLVP